MRKLLYLLIEAALNHRVVTLFVVPRPGMLNNALMALLILVLLLMVMVVIQVMMMVVMVVWDCRNGSLVVRIHAKINDLNRFIVDKDVDVKDCAV